MSVHGKEARPGRCYCHVRDEGASLNDIAKIITALNHKILVLRNEVNAFKNVGANCSKKSLDENKSDHLSVPNYETEPGIFPSNVQPDGPLQPETAAVHMIPFQTRSIINYQLERHEKVDSEVLADILNSGVNSNAYSKFIYKKFPRAKKIKVSRGMQYDPTMGRQRIGDFFNCLKTALLATKITFLKWNRESNLRNDNHVPFDLEHSDAAFPNFEDDELGGTIDWTFEAVKIEKNGAEEMLDPFKRVQGNKMFRSGLNKDKGTLREDEENGHLGLECSINRRMGGGAENRVISDFNSKLQKLGLYKTLKLDVESVKRRLDACIDQLNEIIEDVSIIFSALHFLDALKNLK